MSILLQNASASFVQVATPDDRYHLVLKVDLVGHSELQDRLIKKIAQSKSLQRSVTVVKGANDVPQLQVHLSAFEKEVADLIAREDANRLVQQKEMDRSYTPQAADAKLSNGPSKPSGTSGGVKPLQLQPPVKSVSAVSGQGVGKNGPAQDSGASSADPEAAL
jgi:hypothetical protein